MLQKISTKDLAVGMFIANTGVSWLTHKGLCTLEGIIPTEDLLLKIQAKYSEAYIDLARSRKGSLPPALADLLHPKPVEGYLPPQPRVPMREELEVASAIYDDSIVKAKELMDNMRKGNLTVSLEEPMVGDILESLDRNVDALFGLCKLRQADEYTYTHCVNVSVLATMFGRGLGLDRDMQKMLGLGGLFHDLGKAKIPMEIVNAPRKLSDAEFSIMKQHPALGYKQLISVPGIPDTLLAIVAEHHERYDGTGYPKGLKADEISLAGVITGIADVFDALSSRRCYKEALPLPKVTSILYSMRDRDFPASMVEKFIVLMGVFPVGSCVQLSDGRSGIVSGSNPANVLKPKVIVLQDDKGRNIKQMELDLMNEQGVEVSTAVSAATLKVDPADILGIGG